MAWVVMPDHMHWLMRLDEHIELSAVVRRVKSSTAVAINRQLGRSGSVWHPAFHDRALRQDDDVVTVARYIVANPLRAGLVLSLGDYPLWDAVWLGTPL